MTAHRFYAACLASYNNGVLHGVWINASDDVAAMRAEVDAMLRASKFPNVAVRRPGVTDEQWNDFHARFPEHDDQMISGLWGGLTVPSAEEWAIHAHEGLLDIPVESTTITEISMIMEAIDEAESEGIVLDVLQAWCDEKITAFNLADMIRQYRDAYLGEANSEAEFAEQWADDAGLTADIPEAFARHIDWESYARDMRLGGDVHFIRVDGTVYAFSGHC